MGKVLYYLYSDMADFEITFSSHLLGACAGKEIITVAYEKNIIKSRSGMEYRAKTSVAEACGFSDVEALVITGGYQWNQRQELTKLIQKLDREGVLLAAICAGPIYLARAGVLDHKKYTTTLTEEYFKNNGVVDPFPRENFIDDVLVIDKNIITSINATFIDFGIEIADHLKCFNTPEEKNEFIGIYKNTNSFI